MAAAVDVRSLLSSRPPLRRRLVDGMATVTMVAAAATALVVLLLVVGYLVRKGAGIISPAFLTSSIPRNARVEGGGMYPAIIGTLVITGGAAAMAVPLGVLGAIYLNEFGKQRPLARFIRFMADVMTGVPSIVMGLFIYTIWVVRFHQLSGLAGALALACLMLPIVIRTTEEMLRLVPDELRHASQALGARTWRTTLTVVLPAALSGIISGAMLAVARAAGETAPLLFTIGASRQYNWSLSDPNTALSAQIFSNAQTGFPNAIDRAWGAALTLIVLVLLLSTVARIIAARLTVR